MTNEVIFSSMLTTYEDKAFTNQYIFGFTDRQVVYMVFADSTILPLVCCLDRASSRDGGGYSIRFKPTKSQKELLKTCQLIPLCSTEFFETEYENCQYNRGEVFEKLVTEYFGQEWIKDNVPFTKGGDITVDGIVYQIKYQKATFCNEKSLHNLCN